MSGHISALKRSTNHFILEQIIEPQTAAESKGKSIAVTLAPRLM
jgi:hypothetical protein